MVWIEDDGTVQVVSTNKAAFSLQQQLSRVTGVPIEQIVVDCMFIGGDFGGKGHSLDDYVCYFLAKATGRPIKSITSYTDELVAGNPRNSSRFYLKTAVGKDGTILAHESRVYYDDGAYAAARPLPGPILEGWSALEPYRVPHAHMETFLVYTNKVLGGQMRAPGAMHTSFAGECHVDDIALKLGMDRLEFRLHNAIRKGDTTSANVLVREPRALAVLEAIKADSSWSDPLPPNHGRGLSIRSRHVGQGNNEVLMQLLPDGRIEILEGSPDQGGGAATVVQRVAAAVLSIDPDQITVRYGTTAEAPFSPGPGASRSTHILGQATIAGSISFKEKLEDRAADAMGWRVGTVQLIGDHFVVADGSNRSVPIAAVAPKILAAGPLEEMGAYDSAAQHSADGEDLNYCCYMIEVEVDPETGQVRPVTAVLAVDVGTIINPLGHQGQLEGGFVFGLGNSLMEEIVFTEDGRVTTANLGDYKLPTELDVPPFRVIHVPAIVGPGPFGAKSAGETANNAVAAAVANAVRAATGVPVTHAPISSERVVEALNAR
jgi:putative selenate reductase molybdopterin-binding subunit